MKQFKMIMIVALFSAAVVAGCSEKSKGGKPKGQKAGEKATSITEGGCVKKSCDSKKTEVKKTTEKTEEKKAPEKAPEKKVPEKAPEKKDEGNAASKLSEKKVDGMALLDLKLPKPLFEGTPKEVKGIKNLEVAKPKGWKRKPFYVPAGSVNLAKGKKVVCSGLEPIIGEPKMVTDGEKAGHTGTFVELDPGLQSVTIDLEQMCEIYAVVIWHFHKEARVYKDVIVMLGEDKDFTQGKTVIYNNDDDNSAQQGVGFEDDYSYFESYQGKLIDANKHTKKQAKGRFIRLYSNGSSSGDVNHYIEVEVYGKPVK